MYASVLTATTIFSTLSLVASTPLTPRQSNKMMALGYREVHDGSQFIAWLPSETPIEKVCDDNVVISNNHSGNIDHPICGTSFSLGDYNNVYLACATNPGTPSTDDVVSVKNACGIDILKCVPDQSEGIQCDTNIGVGQKFLCTAP